MPMFVLSLYSLLNSIYSSRLWKIETHTEAPSPAPPLPLLKQKVTRARTDARDEGVELSARENKEVHGEDDGPFTPSLLCQHLCPPVQMDQSPSDCTSN